MKSDFETLTWIAKEILPVYQQNWLLEAIEILRGDFKQIGETIPKIVVEVEYPNSHIPYTWLGQYQRCAWGDLIHHSIFINPSIGGLEALDILVHELVHAVANDLDHDGRFPEVAAAIGLDDTGPHACAEEILLKRLKEIKEMLGEYPRVGALA